MYARHMTMRLYEALSRWGSFTWKVIQVAAILYVLGMALSYIYIGIVRDSEYRGAERKKIQNYETHRQIEAERKGIKKP